MLEKKLKSSLAKSISEHIGETITSNYGESVAKIIFNNFEARFGLKKNDIALQPVKFEELLEDIFGKGAACLVVKHTLVKELERQFYLQIQVRSRENTSVAHVITLILSNAN